MTLIRRRACVLTVLGLVSEVQRELAWIGLTPLRLKEREQRRRQLWTLAHKYLGHRDDLQNRVLLAVAGVDIGGGLVADLAHILRRLLHATNTPIAAFCALIVPSRSRTWPGFVPPPFTEASTTAAETASTASELADG